MVRSFGFVHRNCEKETPGTKYIRVFVSSFLLIIKNFLIDPLAVYLLPILEKYQLFRAALLFFYE